LVLLLPPQAAGTRTREDAKVRRTR
jgi:hypothetical protein